MAGPGTDRSRPNRVLRLGAFGAGTAAFLALLFFARFELIGAALFVAGSRAEGCSWEGAVSGLRATNLEAELAKSIESRMKHLESGAGFELWQTPNGQYWVPKGKAPILAPNLAEQQRGIYSPYGLGVKSGDIVLDCGANMGVYTRAALAAGASRVIAIEPAPENLECLRRTFAREIASGRVTLVEKGVWHQDHVLEMFQQPDNNAADSFVVDWTGRGRKVRLPLTTIDRIVEELNLPRVDYIKMDIEGAERNALDGGVRTLRRFHPAMALCVYHLKDDPVVIPQRVRAAWPGYRQRCGPCLDTNRRFRPQVYFFY